MKKVFIVLSVTALLSSCGGPGTSTAAGAADCICGLMDEMVVAVANNDEAKLDELDEKGEKYEEEIEKAIEEGKYTEDELKAILKERNCTF